MATTFRVGHNGGFIARYPEEFGGTWRTADDKFLAMPPAPTVVSFVPGATSTNPLAASVTLDAYTWEPAPVAVNVKFWRLAIKPPTGYTGQLNASYQIGGFVHDPQRKYITLGCYSRASTDPQADLTELGLRVMGARGNPPAINGFYDSPTYDMYLGNFAAGSPPVYKTAMSVTAPFYRWGLTIYQWVGDAMSGMPLAPNGHRKYTEFIVAQGPAPIDELEVMDIISALNP